MSLIVVMNNCLIIVQQLSLITDTLAHSYQTMSLLHMPQLICPSCSINGCMTSCCRHFLSSELTPAIDSTNAHLELQFNFDSVDSGILGIRRHSIIPAYVTMHQMVPICTDFALPKIYRLKYPPNGPIGQWFQLPPPYEKATPKCEITFA